MPGGYEPRRSTDITITEMHQTVGWLRAKQEEMEKSNERLLRTLDGATQKLDEVADKLGKVAEVLPMVHELKIKVEGIEKIKQRGIGILIGTGVGSAGLGAAITHFLIKSAKVFGG
ncbi:MAG: hypothetical protein KGL39_04060 [Patescibacteria group bacterium]|nr:hypothetical protein [Patescibacteria group bacterium]